MRLRKRAVGLLFGALLLFVLGTNVQAGWLFVIAALMLGTVIAGMLLALGTLRGIRVDREAPEQVSQGDEVTVELRITNASRSCRLGVVAVDPHLEPGSILVGSLRARGQVEVVTRRRALRRGPQGPTPVRLSSAAPFGVLERRRRIDVAGETLVLPAVVPLGPISLPDVASAGERPVSTAPRRGHGLEYLGVREYRSGDSMRYVHWPSTARLGSLMVREFEQERTPRVAIVVDDWADDRVDEAAMSALDACCCAAASIAHAVAARGSEVRLLLPGGSDERRSGADDVVHQLAFLESSGVTFRSRLAGLVTELPGEESLVIVFPTWHANEAAALAPVVGELVCTVTQVLAIAVELPAEVRVPRLRSDELRELVDGLWDSGADVRVWRLGEDLSTSLDPATAVSA